MLTFPFNIISCSLFPLQSKHNEDALVTRPILLDELEFEVHLFSFLLPPLFFFARVSSAVYFCLIHLLKSSLDLHIFFFSSSRMSPSLFLYTTPRPRSFLPP